MFTFDHIARITGGKIRASNRQCQIVHFLTDSRKIVNPKESVFVAIKGEHHDGHNYIASLFENGVHTFIVENEHSIPSNILINSNILVVDNSMAALQKIATFHRQQFHYPVIGITGSNAKTIIKEWLGQLLAVKYNIIKSPKSYNSQLGVPLSVLAMRDRHVLAIFEAGISMPNEMENLQQVIKPTIGIFTNIGSAHDEGFRSREAKIHEKWKLFTKCEKVIYCADHKEIQETKPAHLNALTWGFNEAADLKIHSLEKEQKQGTVIKISYHNEVFTFTAPFSDDASLENVMHCIAVLVLLDIPKTAISELLSKLTNVEMRLELKRGINNCYLVDDSYNNDLGGLQIAIDFLKNQPGDNRSIILSDILQSGMEEKDLYAQLNSILVENDIKKLVGIGDGMMRNKSRFSLESRFYRTTTDFLNEFSPEQFSSETILIKGARPFGFEEISNMLSEKIHRTVLEINLDALNHNLNYYRSKLNDGVKLMVMVKAAAYGNGSFEIANLLQFNRVDYLAVAYVDEGVELRKHGIELPIMVMNVAVEDYGNLLNYDLEPEVYSLNQLEGLVAFFVEREANVKVHIKIDSGMHRLGFEEKEIGRMVNFLKPNPSIEVASIYSHLAGADEEKHLDFSKSQARAFLKMADSIETKLGIHPLKHILNSAGIIRFPEFQLDMVRLGIGLYGFEANQLEQGKLRPISKLKTVISQVKNIRQGETIGYGRKGIAKRDSKIATIAIGYADGFLRAFSNGKISLLVNGKPAPVIGNICMDMCMLDISGIDARAGDEVIVFGEQPSIKQLADAIGTIPYEILTNISSRVSRIFYTN